MARFRKSMGDLNVGGKMRASTLLFKGSSTGNVASVNRAHDIPAARRRAAASMRIDTIGVKEQRRRLRCTAVESDESWLDVSHFTVALASAITARMRLVGEIEACEWLEHPSFIMLAFDRYVRFLELRRDHPDEHVVAPLDVRCIWLCHLQRPLLFSTDIRERYGDATAFSVPNILDEVHFMQGGADIDKSKKLWSSAFGEPWEFEELVESLALRYEEYHQFCEASYEDLTAENSTNQRCQDWIQFGISSLHVLSDRRRIEEEKPVFEGYDLQTLNGTSVAFSVGLLNQLILRYNGWIVRTAHHLLEWGSCAVAFPPPFPVKNTEGASSVWHAHMCFPRQYTRDCKRALGGLLIEAYDKAVDSVGGGLDMRLKRFFNLPAPEYEPKPPRADPPANDDVVASLSEADEPGNVQAEPVAVVRAAIPARARAQPLPIDVPFDDADNESEASDVDYDELYDSDCDKWDFS